MLKKIIKLDKFLDHHAPLLILLLVVVMFRIPNLAEPYWYGDEGIYLTIGQSLNKGAVLYKDIVDHKTPIIYYLARVHTQLNFRLLLMGWMLVSTTLFYAISMKTLGRRKFATLATTLFVALTTLPWLEGNIPNGELFVIGFVLAGGFLLLKTRLGEVFAVAGETRQSDSLRSLTRKDIYLLLAGGGFFGLAILTKVPALFDLVGLGSVALISLYGVLSFAPHQSKQFFTTLKERLTDYSLVLAGALAPIILSIVCFASKKALPDYLEYGLLYNLRYAGTWQLSFKNPLLQFLFTMPGKFTLTAVLVILILLLTKKLSKVTQFASIWLTLALFASLLSNRPYPHYFLQIVPPLALLVGAVATQISLHLRLGQKNKIIYPALELAKSFGLIVAILLLLHVRPYPTLSYYQRWTDFALNKVNKEEYRAKFNYIMSENYEVASYLRKRGADRIFIWGTNPMLYALSDAWPASRFVVAFHIKDMNVFDKTLAEISSVRPKFIVVMDREQIEFPEFFGYLFTNYQKVKQTEHMSVWSRMNHPQNDHANQENQVIQDDLSEEDNQDNKSIEAEQDNQNNQDD